VNLPRWFRIYWWCTMAYCACVIVAFVVALAIHLL
jgi:hypothetical protein